MIKRKNLFLDAYTSTEVMYSWDKSQNSSVSFVPGMALSQFDLISSPYRNLSILRKEGESIFKILFPHKISNWYLIVFGT